jgi:hypothetical protein
LVGELIDSITLGLTPNEMSVYLMMFKFVVEVISDGWIPMIP